MWYRWCQTYAAMTVEDAKRLKKLEAENKRGEGVVGVRPSTTPTGHTNHPVGSPPPPTPPTGKHNTNPHPHNNQTHKKVTITRFSDKSKG